MSFCLSFFGLPRTDTVMVGSRCTSAIWGHHTDPRDEARVAHLFVSVICALVSPLAALLIFMHQCTITGVCACV